MTVPRLPVVGSDLNTWGTLLNDWLVRLIRPVFVLFDDGTTTWAINRNDPDGIFTSNTNSATVMQTVIDAMDPVNGGIGGEILLTKPSSGSGYRWGATVETPLNLSVSQRIDIKCESGVVFRPTRYDAFPLFANKSQRVQHANVAENADGSGAATVTVLTSTASDGSAIPTGPGYLAMNTGRLMHYTAFNPSTKVFSGITYAGNASKVIGSGSGALVYSAVQQGSGGTAITIEYLNDADGAATTTVTVAGNAISVHCKNNVTSITANAGQVVNAIRASAAADALVDVALGYGYTGSTSPNLGTVAAIGPQALSVSAAISTSGNGSWLHIVGATWQHFKFDFTGATLDATQLGDQWNIATSGTPTGGTFTMTLTGPGLPGGAVTTGAIARNSSAAAMKTVIDAALLAAGSSAVSTTSGGALPTAIGVSIADTAGNRIAFVPSLAVNSLTGGTSPAPTFAPAVSSTCLWVGQAKSNTIGVMYASWYGNHLNIEDVYVEAGTLINDPLYSSIYAVFFASYHHSFREPVQSTLVEVGVSKQRYGTPENVNHGACNSFFGGKVQLDFYTVGNILVDRYHFNDNVAVTDKAGRNLSIFQCGQSAKTGWGEVLRNKCDWSADLMIEIDNVQTYCKVADNDWGQTNSTGTLFFYFTNGAAVNPDGSAASPTIYHENNTSRFSQLPFSGGGAYFRLYSQSSSLNAQEPYRGTIYDRNNLADWTQVPASPILGAAGSTGNVYFCQYGSPGNTIPGDARIVTEGNTIDLGKNITMANSNGASMLIAWVLATQAGQDFKCSGGVANVVKGTITHSGNFQNIVCMLNVGGNWQFNDPLFVADITCVPVGAGTPNNAMKAVSLAGQSLSISNGSLTGRLRIKLKNFGGVANPNGIEVGDTARLTMPKPFVIDYDGSGLAPYSGTLSAANEILYNTTSNLGNIHFTAESRFFTVRPIKTVASGSYVGSGVTTRNDTGHPVNCYVTGGTVSAFKITNDGVAANGIALPNAAPFNATGVNVGVIPPGGGVVCTSTGAPTVTMIPIHAGPTP